MVHEFTSANAAHQMISAAHAGVKQNCASVVLFSVVVVQVDTDIINGLLIIKVARGLWFRSLQYLFTCCLQGMFFNMFQSAMNCARTLTSSQTTRE